MSEIQIHRKNEISQINDDVEYSIQEAKHTIIQYKEAYNTDISKHIEDKAGFKYLSWAYAIMHFKTNFPDGSWGHIKPYKDETGWYVETWVKTHIHAEPIHEIYPVFEQRSRTDTQKGGMYPVEKPTNIDINKAYKRCLTKNIAMVTGIGLHLYAGEDLPEDKPVIDEEDALWFLTDFVPNHLIPRINKGVVKATNFYKLVDGLWFGKQSINELKGMTNGTS